MYWTPEDPRSLSVLGTQALVSLGHFDCVMDWVPLAVLQKTKTAMVSEFCGVRVMLKEGGVTVLEWLVRVFIYYALCCQ